MRILRNLLVFISTFIAINTFAQVSSLYSFSETTGTYTAITGGTQLVTTTGGATTYDTDGSYFTIPSGSQFQFNNTTITSVNMTADGALFLNPGTTTTGNSVTGPISSTGTAVGVITGMGMDLRSTAIASQVYERRWEDVGTEVVFQWQNVARYLQSSSERFSFQIRVNKSNGQIRVVYGNMTTITTSTTYQPMVGLRGSTNTDYNNRRLTTSIPDATPNWGAPNGTTAGTSNAHSVRFRSGCVPTSGLIFIWTVQSCVGPTLPAIAYTSSSTANLSWTAPSPAPGSGYSWEIRTSGAGGSGAVGLVTSGTSATTTAAATGLSQQTSYTLYVQSNCGGSTSSWVASTASTSPPTNNDCVNATSVTVNGSSTCTLTTSGNSLGATQTSAACSGTGADDDIWFSFVATNASHVVTVTPGTMSDVVFQVYSGNCSGLSSLACIDATGGTSVETTTVGSLTAGITYYMRVHSYASTVGSRGTFTVCITTPCTIPTVAGTLSSDKASTVVNDAVTFSITGNGGSVTLFEWSFDNFGTVAGSTANPVMPYTLQLNVAQTLMYFRATSVSGSCPSGVTSPISVTIELAPPYTYGVSDGDYITNVNFSDINNTSTEDGDAYSNYLSIVGNAEAGGTYTITVSGTLTFSAYPGYAAWIDWNQDGVFQTSENILLAAPGATGTATVNVPNDVTSGTVKMRVLSVWNATPTNDAYYATGYGYGEIEEYSITLGVALPVELISFNAICSDDGTLITWKTASESNTSHFNLEKSRNGIDWEIIHTEQAAGNSTQLVTYNFTDKSSLNGLSYYRLNQYDLNGVYEQFGPISINCLKIGGGYFSIFPNPSSTSFSVMLNNDLLIGDATLLITNKLGKEVYVKSIKVEPGINLYSIDKLDISTGVYYISIINSYYTSGVLKQVIR